MCVLRALAVVPRNTNVPPGAACLDALACAPYSMVETPQKSKQLSTVEPRLARSHF